VDLFLGSGSTLIPSDKTGRVRYSAELDPLYVDVIVRTYKPRTKVRFSSNPAGGSKR
jgi:hypothetical protein